MKNYFLPVSLFYILFFSFFLVSCDTDDDNDPSTLCEADFYTLTTSGTVGTPPYDIYSYQKSTSFQSPVPLLTNFNLNTSGMSLMYFKSTFDKDGGIIVYQIARAHNLIKFDIQTQNIVQISKNPVTDGFYPEFVNHNLYFLQIVPTTFDSHNDIAIADLNIKDNAGMLIANTSLNFSNSGFKFNLNASSTSDLNEKIFYLANTSLVTYNVVNQGFSFSQLEVFDVLTNAVYYAGVEYVDSQTLYALRINTTTNAVDLIQINTGANPTSITVLQNLQGLSMQAADIVNNIEYIKSAYDDCDNSYYFTYTDAYNSSIPVIVEVKPDTGSVTEYPFSVNSGEIFYSLEINN